MKESLGESSASRGNCNLNGLAYHQYILYVWAGPQAVVGGLIWPQSILTQCQWLLCRTTTRHLSDVRLDPNKFWSGLINSFCTYQRLYIPPTPQENNEHKIHKISAHNSRGTPDHQISLQLVRNFPVDVRLIPELAERTNGPHPVFCVPANILNRFLGRFAQRPRGVPTRFPNSTT